MRGRWVPIWLAPSQRFLDQIPRGGVPAVKLDVLENGVPIAELAAVTVQGHVQVDRQQVRRSAEITVVDEAGTLTPKAARDLLIPYGNEVRPYRGFRFLDAPGREVVELAPLGTLVITDAQITWPTITLKAMDRAWLVAQARFETTYTVAAGTPYHTAIEELLRDRLPAHVFDVEVPDTGETTPLLAFEPQDDPMRAAVQMATAVGMVLYPDPLGTFRAHPEADPGADPPVMRYEAGVESRLLTLGRTWSAEGVYNGVVAVGENQTSGTTFRAVAWDTNPYSPTFYLGKFGRRPRFFASPLLNTQQQTDSAARKLLLQQLGLSDALRFTGFCNPLHESGDVIAAAYPEIGLAGTYVLDSFTIPLQGTEAMPAAARERFRTELD